MSVAEISALTVVTDIPAPLAKAEALNGLAIESSANLVKAFAPHFSSFYSLVDEAKAIPEDSPIAAKKMRLRIVKIRTGADKTRKDLKADALRMSGAIDGINKLLLNDLAPVEKVLEDIEKKEERREADRVTTLANARRIELGVYVVPENLVHYDLGNMSVASYSQLFAGAKAAHEAQQAALAKAEEARLAAIKKTEEDRVTKEAADALERAKLAAENTRLAEEAKQARLAKEAIEKASLEKEAKLKAEREKETQRIAAAQKVKDEAAAKERQKTEALAKQEKEKREALEVQLKAQQDAQKEKERLAKEDAQKAEQEAAAKAKKAAAAPDREKLLAFAKLIRALEAPKLATNMELEIELRGQTNKFAVWVEAKAAKL